MLHIPKESTPEIEFGIISISTFYEWVNPLDIDTLITDKIEKEIKDIDGINKIRSNSSVGMSLIVLELKNDASTRDVMTDVKDRIDSLTLPEDAEDSVVKEISFSNELMYEANFFTDSKVMTRFELMQKLRKLISDIEGTNSIESIGIGSQGTDPFAGTKGWDSEYEIRVRLDKNKLDVLWISLLWLNQTLTSNNKNTPLGNYAIGDLNYDFRFDGKLNNIEALKNMIISWKGASLVRLWDVATISQVYDDSKLQFLGTYNDVWNIYVTLRINKVKGASIFSASKVSKSAIEKYIADTPWFENIAIKYSQDMAANIMADYKNLEITALQTMLLVFVTILIFVGFWESIIAIILLPLAFFITFMYLDFSGMTMNFLTNFSLVLTLWIAIDTIIVIIEWASERQKLGYHRKNAAILAVRDLRAPLISGTATTLVAFLPMIFLPWVMGRFLSFIPITVFSTLLAALILALTISTALFFKLVPQKKVYHRDKTWEEALSKDEYKFLENERSQKREVKEVETFRERMLEFLSEKYYSILSKFIKSRKNRIFSVIVPFVLLIFSFIFLSPKIGFTLFPESDEWMFTLKVEAQQGSKKEVLEPYIGQIEKYISAYPELKVYTLSIQWNIINGFIELTDSKQRQRNNEKSVFEIVEELSQKMESLGVYWLATEVKIIEWWPPGWSPAGVKIIANKAENISTLKKVADEFKVYLQSIPGAKNVTTSSSDNPWQFVFTLDRAKLAYQWVNPNDILTPLRIALSWMNAGSISSRYEDNTVRLEIEQYQDSISPQEIENMIVTTSAWKLRIGDYASYTFEPALSTITRENGNIQIAVNADIMNGYLPTDVQPKLIKFAENYHYPEGIRFISGGENQENADLIMSTIQSFFIAVFLIFTILVFQFNSFSQPVIILYSVVLALLGVNIGLFLTGNPYSMTFGIGFIALTWVVVNDAIILIDRINRNIERLKRNTEKPELLEKSDYVRALTAAGKSRLQPIIVTTLTTLFGVLPLAMQDAFWAGLGYTLIFGLFAGSFMTLFITPALYYMIYLNKKIRQ